MIRRDFLKAAGFITLGLFFEPVEGICLTKGKKEGGYAMVIDLGRCMGCEACAVACKVVNDTPYGRFNTVIKTTEFDTRTGPRWAFLPALCNHCEGAPCMKSCPNKAIVKNSLGIVLIDHSRCEGIGLCKDACPYGMIYLDPRLGMKAQKCDFCLGRLEKGLVPACVETCPSRARVFGQLDSPEGEFAQYLRRANLYTLAAKDKRLKGRVFYVINPEGSPFRMSRV